jgi:glycosyltransferase involved in cell wall biosynthesis
MAVDPARIQTALDAVARAPTILAAIHATPALVEAASALALDTGGVGPGADRVVGELRRRLGDADDRLTAIAAIHALSRIPGDAVDAILSQTLDEAPADLIAHVAWAGSARRVSAPLLDRFVDLVIGGRLAGMHAQAALERWARTDPLIVAAALRSALDRCVAPGPRRYLVETLGLVPDDSVLDDLARLAVDPDEGDATRIAAIAAFGDRAWEPMPREVAALGAGDGPIAESVALARHDRVATRHDTRVGGFRHPADRPAVVTGSRIAQLHLGAELDREMRRSGVGATGGIATLLVDLDAALGRQPGIESVVTIGRGTMAEALHGGLSGVARGFSPVPLQPGEDPSFLGDWPARVAAERGLRRIVRGAGRPDLIHLRMADVGSLAGSRVAAEGGIRTVFSLAPDPHGLIAASEAAGRLDRRSFGAEDARLHLWFRADLVERLARQADQVVLFPREGLEQRLRDLVGIDVAAAPRRFTVIPEGIDVARIEAADRALASSVSPEGLNGGLDALISSIAALPARRHGLPIALSIGRLHDVKGMARLVAAYAADSALRARANLVIVGGDLHTPTPDEAAELERIDATFRFDPALRDEVILLGHRPNGDVGYLLVAAHRGVSDVIAPSGAYVCASAKEEFGLAIVEALAAGLVVVAPDTGGPTTYVEDGRTGFLVDTARGSSLARGIHAALDRADAPGRDAYARSTIRARYDISVMAAKLAGVYAEATIERQQRAS